MWYYGNMEEISKALLKEEYTFNNDMDNTDNINIRNIKLIEPITMQELEEIIHKLHLCFLDME